MSTVLIDTCIVSDLADETSDWFEWSSSMLESLDGSHSFVINPLCQHTCRLQSFTLGDKNAKIQPGI